MIGSSDLKILFCYVTIYANFLDKLKKIKIVKNIYYKFEITKIKTLYQARFLNITNWQL